jgi:predicted ArsR family transcriptional regulator
MMRPHSIASQCLRALRDGPATTGEVAAELGRDPHNVCAHLTALCLRGKLQKQRFPTGNKRVRNLWMLPGQQRGAA